MTQTGVGDLGPSKTGYLGTPRRKRRGKTRAAQGRDEIVGPTPEMRARKAEVHPGIEIIDPKTGKVRVIQNIHASIEALDLLLARKQITEHQHRAGVVYRALREFLYGRQASGSARWGAVIHEHLDGDAWKHGRELTDDEKVEMWTRRMEKFDKGNKALEAGPLAFLGSRALVRKVVLEDYHPKQIELYGLREGLRVLAKVWRLRDNDTRHE